MSLLDLIEAAETTEPLEEGAVVLRGFARSRDSALLAAVEGISTVAPFRHLKVPGGHTMSVAMTGCGPVGWVSDEKGYRYSPLDPLRDAPWPAMPSVLDEVAREAAGRAGFTDYAPDTCLINRYVKGAKLSLHQDRNEHSDREPIVSVSLGISAIFLWGGAVRTAPARKLRLNHGDVVVWGGPARMRFHGVSTIADGVHPKTGACRINLTFRRARPVP
jgi:alkylated DNA repair protein (DNA oxidative demethylase)